MLDLAKLNLSLLEKAAFWTYFLLIIFNCHVAKLVLKPDHYAIDIYCAGAEMAMPAAAALSE